MGNKAKTLIKIKATSPTLPGPDLTRVRLGVTARVKVGLAAVPACDFDNNTTQINHMNNQTDGGAKKSLPRRHRARHRLTVQAAPPAGHVKNPWNVATVQYRPSLKKRAYSKVALNFLFF